MIESNLPGLETETAAPSTADNARPASSSSESATPQEVLECDWTTLEVVTSSLNSNSEDSDEDGRTMTSSELSSDLCADVLERGRGKYFDGLCALLALGCFFDGEHGLLMSGTMMGPGAALIRGVSPLAAEVAAKCGDVDSVSIEMDCVLTSVAGLLHTRLVGGWGFTVEE